MSRSFGYSFKMKNHSLSLYFLHFPESHTKNRSFSIREKKALLCFSRNYCRAIRNEFYLFLSHLLFLVFGCTSCVSFMA